MDKRRKYFWQGEPVKTEFWLCIVFLVKEKPLWWYNYECAMSSGLSSAVVPVIKVIHETGDFLIANHFGIGAHKLKAGGWPSHKHSSVNGDLVPYEKYQRAPIKLDLEGYEAHEEDRTLWQRKNFPEEMKERDGHV